ncbi:peptidase domain-containing ABC transporter [Chitinophaga sp. 22321]|uniref:Peptidase domain-containing ABC transporter n=1 Tax=Chitinophaga hostae TaxID=2831022 RepID=A0ABS5IYV5_9BACT|nr:peptidase domain-containing ABC transporter [Chitinophaga hostae]MBS0028145.1 peptidase domain-containing ABC transporter [Chitinophaga hostae]
MALNKFPCDRQLDLMDCGPACLKMIAKHYGKYYSLQFLRDKCGITKEGVSFHDISYAGEQIGLRTLSLKCTVKDLVERIPLPVIVHWDNSHFMVVYKTNPGAGTIYTSDPAKGYVKYSSADFAEKWVKPGKANVGVLMAMEPQSEFYEDQQEEARVQRKTLSSFLNYFRPYKKSFFHLCVIMIIVTLLQALLPFISKAMIDVGIQTHDISFLNIVLLANIVIYLSILISNVARDWILLHVTSRVNVALISDYLNKLMRLPISFFENKLTGDILQRANDHERIRNFVMNNSLSMLFSTITFAIFSVVLLIYSKIVFGIFIAGSLLYVIWVMGFLQLRKKLDWQYFELTSKNQSYWVETIEAIQDIKINNYEQPKRWKWETIQAKLYKINTKSLNVNNLQNSGAQFIDSVKNLVIVFYCARAVIDGQITFGVMISTQFIIGMLNAPVAQFIGFMMNYQLAKISFLRLNEIQQLEDEHMHVGENPVDLPDKKGITLQNVYFQYTPHGEAILKGINLVIPEKKVTAIVGDSGSGKTTLLKLILRLFKPSHGEILLGSMNINNISLKQWRNKCGAVMQDGKIFNDTILNNIVLDDEKIDYGRLKRALETANIAQEIERLPLGYQTKMGEQGRGLSGGQKQRVLIARALYKDPDFLFFDEATNSLDSLNEQKIVEALDNVFKDKTVVVIAHRLSTIRKADQIVVMQDGAIVEIGNHNGLMQQKGRYYQLIQSQLDLTSTMEALVERISQSAPDETGQQYIELS